MPQKTAPAGWLGLHHQLAQASRLPTLSRDRVTGSLEFGVLMLAGALAAATSAFVDLHLRIPGHAILKAVFPMAFGLALVPRRGAGMLMGASALLCGGAISGLHGAALGIGALVSLSLTGPLLDVALHRATTGRGLLTAFMLAGLGSNLVAFAARGLAKVSAAGPFVGSRPLEIWVSNATWSYPLCGLLAGLVSALVWFQLRSQQDQQ